MYSICTEEMIIEILDILRRCTRTVYSPRNLEVVFAKKEAESLFLYILNEHIDILKCL